MEHASTQREMQTAQFQSAPEKVIDQAGKALAAGLTANNGAVALPERFQLHDLENYLSTRRRAAGLMTTPFINDFVAYVELHKQDGCTIFVDADQMQGKAVLDLGTPAAPGHCANVAALAPKATAAFASLKSVIERQRNQKETAEWLEDWAPILKAQADGQEIDIRKAIQAVRSITIEGLNKIHHEEQSLSATRSAFESVKASSEETLPSHFLFKCKPYPDLKEREFVLRLSVLTDGKPMLVLRPWPGKPSLKRWPPSLPPTSAKPLRTTCPC